MLKIGALKCYKDGAALHFESIGGMRLRVEDGKGDYYNARCPKCISYYRVRADKGAKS